MAEVGSIQVIYIGDVSIVQAEGLITKLVLYKVMALFSSFSYNFTISQENSIQLQSRVPAEIVTNNKAKHCRVIESHGWPQVHTLCSCLFASRSPLMICITILFIWNIYIDGLLLSC